MPPAGRDGLAHGDTDAVTVSIIMGRSILSIDAIASTIVEPSSRARSVVGRTWMAALVFCVDVLGSYI